MPPTATTNKRTTVTQGVKLAAEAIPGTAATTGLKELTSLGMTPTINPTVTAYKPMGQKYTTLTTLNREDSTWKMDGHPTFTEIVYALSSVLTEAEITPPAGTTSAASGARVMGADGTHWFFKPSATDADAPVSFTVYKGSIAAAERATFWRVGDFTLTYNRNDTTIAGSATGRALEAGMSMPGNEIQQVAVNATGGTFTLTYAGQTTTPIAYNAAPAVMLAALEALNNIPTGAMRVTQTVATSPAFTYVIEFGGTLGETNVAQITSTATGLTGGTSAAVVTTVTGGAVVNPVNLIPVQPTQVCIYAFAAAQTSISLTTNETAAFRLTDVMEVQLIISGRYGPYYTLDCTQSSYAALIELAPTLQFAIKMQADSVGLGYLTQLRNGGTVYFRVKASGDVIATVEHYELTYDFAGKITASSELADSDGVVSVTWTFDGVPTLINGGPLEVVAVNNVTGL
jgi:hypothetical protein